LRHEDLEGYTDLHNHLVPGVDDGSRNLDESRDGLRRLWNLGVRRIITTPHLDGSLTRDKDMLVARLDEMDRAWGELREMAAAEFPEIEIRRGHEVMLDIPDPDLSDRRLRLAGTSFALVEWPGLQVPPSTVPVVERLVESGVRPVIAHPERYRGMDGGAYLPGEWRACGALLQVNYGSLVGQYGDFPRRRAFSLLERGWVDLMASDFHGRPHLSPSLEGAKKVMWDEGGEEQFRLLARVNPTRILRGEDPMPVQPLTIKPGVLKRVRAFFQTREGW
jgi:protein-tyrosine phosphatase